jgi:hypothetical protein
MHPQSGIDSLRQSTGNGVCRALQRPMTDQADVASCFSLKAVSASRSTAILHLRFRPQNVLWGLKVSIARHHAAQFNRDVKELRWRELIAW